MAATATLPANAHQFILATTEFAPPEIVFAQCGICMRVCTGQVVASKLYIRRVLGSTRSRACLVGGFGFQIFTSLSTQLYCNTSPPPYTPGSSTSASSGKYQLAVSASLVCRHVGRIHQLQWDLAKDAGRKGRGTQRRPLPRAVSSRPKGLGLT